MPGPQFSERAPPSPQKMLLKSLPALAPPWGGSVQIQVSSPEKLCAVSRETVSDGWATVCGSQGRQAPSCGLSQRGEKRVSGSSGAEGFEGQSR